MTTHLSTLLRVFSVLNACRVLRDEAPDHFCTCLVGFSRLCRIFQDCEFDLHLTKLQFDTGKYLLSELKSRTKANEGIKLLCGTFEVTQESTESLMTYLKGAASLSGFSVLCFFLSGFSENPDAAQFWHFVNWFLLNPMVICLALVFALLSFSSAAASGWIMVPFLLFHLICSGSSLVQAVRPLLLPQSKATGTPTDSLFPSLSKASGLGENPSDSQDGS
jgi:hypothetical protein